MLNTIYASFPDNQSAANAVGALLDHGVLASDVSVVAQTIPNYAPHEDVSAEAVHATAEQGITTTTPEDAKVGAAKGAGVGVGVGALAAIASLVIPGFGIVLGGSALALALTGVVATTAAGAVAGATTGILVDQGIDPQTAQAFTAAVEAGGVIVTVNAPSNGVDELTIQDVLAKYGAPHENLRVVPGQHVPTSAVVAVGETPTVVQ